jgi:hypothetical protein
MDPEQDDLLSMGSGAIFIEDAHNSTNRPRLKDVNPKELPWADINKVPYTITGPYLKELFDQAFVVGLHQPMLRPAADQWEQALLKTTDLMLPCDNARCEQKWFVFDNRISPCCPFCGTPRQGTIPVIDLYHQFKPSVWRPENHRLMVYNNQYLYQWHTNRNVIRNEKLTREQKVPVGYFSYHNGKWILVNQGMHALKDLTEDKMIPIGTFVELTTDKKLLTGLEEGSRLLLISIAGAS